MTQYTARTARKFLMIKAAKELRKEIEQAGLDNLKVLAENNISIVGTYLRGCSVERKQEIKQTLAALLSLGVTPDMLLDEVARQMPALAPLLTGREAYKRSELQNLNQFLKEG